MSKESNKNAVGHFHLEMKPDTKKIIAGALFGDSKTEEECVRCHRPPTGFTDRVSEKEWLISKFCQECQDFVFSEDDEEDDEAQDG